jgi:uncharacterized RDD family membrane protein YckC
MGTCSITGKVVPEDELVTIQGQRVCAEGKAILLARLKAGDALPGEQERPTALRRFGCMFVDGLVIGVPFVILIVVVTMIGVGAGASPAVRSTAALYVSVVSILAAGIQIVYFGQMHGRRGQSVGKMAGNIVVVNLDGSPISMSTGYVRAIAYIGPNLLSGLAIVTSIAPLIGITSLLARLWFLADAIVALADRNQQRSLHDRIAGTRVVYRG